MNWKILMYHRVVNPADVSFPIEPGMYVLPETLELHANYLRQNCNVVPLDDLVESILANRPIPKSTVAITFDDGWYDNYTNAWPILKNHGLPATIFLATSYIGTERRYWSDEVARFVRAMMSNGMTNSSSLNTTEFASEIRSAFTSENEQDNLARLLDVFKRAGREGRNKLLDQILQHAQPETDLRRQFMNWSEVKEMALLFRFGSHTHTHPYVPEISSNEFVKECEQSVEQIRGQGLNPSKVFCFPGGYSNPESRAVLAPLGFNSSVGATRGSDFNSQPAHLGRAGIHQDVAYSLPLFTTRIWSGI